MRYHRPTARANAWSMMAMSTVMVVMMVMVKTVLVMMVIVCHPPKYQYKPINPV